MVLAQGNTAARFAVLVLLADRPAGAGHGSGWKDRADEPIATRVLVEATLIFGQAEQRWAKALG
jgi:hypothetical protein